MLWQIDRPRPVPSPTSLVVKNGSKMRSRMAGSMPGPLSETSITISSPCRRVGAGQRRGGAEVRLDQGHQSAEVALEHGEVVGDESERVVDLVGHARREQADRGQLLVLDRHLAHAVALGQVADRPEEVQL